ncbi:MAG: ATP-binding protein, partial [Polyangiales bacterium]
DADRLQQAVSNLVTNAVHHGVADGPIRVTTSGSADEISIAVHNEGKTIDPESLAVLFDPFRRAGSPSGSTSNAGGVGLGLYIVDQIARAHGGSVSVSSTDAGGTTFTMRLPRTAASTPNL